MKAKKYLDLILGKNQIAIEKFENSAYRLI